jgi:hypothetical protein
MDATCRLAHVDNCTTLTQCTSDRIRESIKLVSGFKLGTDLLHTYIEYPY